MIKKVFFTILLSLITILTTQAGGLEAVTGKVPDGYNYWFYCPPDEDFTEEDIENGKPLVIFLHGQSLCGTDLNKVRRYGTISAIEKGRKIDGFVIAPQNPGGSWKPEKIMNVVEYVTEIYNVDMNRIYVLGMSLGGYGAIDFAATYPDRIAAAIGLCGGATVKDLSGLAEMPLWIMHGTGDASVSVAQSDKVVSAVKAAQNGVNRLQYDRIPGMNHSKPARVFYNMDTYDWLFQHSLTDPGRPMADPVKVDESWFGRAYSSLDHSKGYKAKSSATKSSTASKTKKTDKTSKTQTASSKSAKKQKSKVTASNGKKTSSGRA